MSIRIRGRWPEEDEGTQGGNFDRAVEETDSAVFQAIGAAHRRTGDNTGQGMTQALGEELRDALRGLRRPTVTLEDALAMALQSVEDTGTTDTDSHAWDGYDALGEGVRDHSLYHLGRPGECGQHCPAFISYALETEDDGKED